MGFQNAPFGVPNSYTVNFGAYFDDQTAIGPSLLRFGLNQYVRAVCPGNSLDQILGNVSDGSEPNDVIVTVPSQFNFASSASALALAFPNLEHTGAGPTWSAQASSFLPFAFQDTNVLNSNLVNTAVLCALISSGGNPECVTPINSTPQLRQEAPLPKIAQAESPRVHDVFAAQGRLDVLAPSRSLNLAEENEVALRIQTPGLTTVETQQVQYSPDDMTSRKTPHFPEGGWAMVPVLYHPDGSASITVVPRLLGQIVLRIVARFPDGGESKADAVLMVQPPQRSPDKLVVGQRGAPTINAPSVSIFLKPETRTYALTVGAFYGNEKEQIQIDPAFASFQVRTANNAPIIALDKSTGSIKPLQLGEALVETSFGGWTNLTCVVVKNDFDPNERNSPNCKSLFHPGEKPGVSIHR
jgi:hypothetical protein